MHCGSLVQGGVQVTASQSIAMPSGQHSGTYGISCYGISQNVMILDIVVPLCESECPLLEPTA